MPPQATAPAGPDPEEPVAYDREGHPLYRHPEHDEPVVAPTPPVPEITPPIAGAPEVTPQVVPPAFPTAPGELTDAQKHEASIRQYPQLNLSEDEYVIAEIQRDPVGVAQIWGGGLALMMAFALVAFGPNVGAATKILMIIGFAIMSVAVFFGIMLLTRIYKSNRLFLTNESVILETQSSLYKKDEQTVNLDGVEDVTYTQTGFMATTFNYGTIKLTIQGEGTDYSFSYVSSPKRQSDMVHNQVEKFKKVHP